MTTPTRTPRRRWLWIAAALLLLGFAVAAWFVWRPAPVRPDIELFLRGGLAILDRIEGSGYDVWARRPVVSKWRKAALLGGSLWPRLRAAIA